LNFRSTALWDHTKDLQRFNPVDPRVVRAQKRARRTGKQIEEKDKEINLALQNATMLSSGTLKTYFNPFYSLLGVTCNTQWTNILGAFNFTTYWT